MRLIPIVLLLGSVTPAAAQAQDAWKVNRSDRYCTITADLGDGARVNLSRSSSSPHTLVDITPPLRPGRSAADPYAAQGNDLRIAGQPAWRIDVKDGRGGAGTGLEPDQLRSVLDARTLHVTGPGEDSIVALPPGDRVEQDFATCLTELRTAERGSGEPVVTPPRETVSIMRLLREHQPDDEVGRAGWIRVKLTIAAQGHVIACEIIASAGSADRDSWPCRILPLRARFTPATDAAGKPTLGTYEFTLTREH